MKTAVSILCLCLCVWLLAGCAGAAEKDSVKAHGQLSVTNGKLTDSHGKAFQLRGLSSHGINWYPEYLNPEAMRSVKAAGGNVFRIAMYTDAEGGYLADPAGNTALVLDAVRYAKEAGLYVLVDWHILSDGDPNEYREEALTFFRDIASAFPKDPAVLYEICNEPNGASWEAVKEYAAAVIPVIRQTSPEAVIIVGTPSFSSDLTGPALSPLPEENLLYAYHYYAGEHTTYRGLEKALEEGLPVMVSEWGVGKDASGKAALEEGQSFVKFLNEKGVSWCGWSLCNKDEVYSVLRPESTALGGFQEDDLTDVGKLLMGALRGGAK